MRPMLAWAGLVLLGPRLASAESPPRLTEDAVIAAVVHNHPAVAAVQARLRAALLVSKRFEGLPPPGLRATVSQIDPMGAMRPMVMLMAEQSIPLGGQRRAAADASVAAAQVQQVDEPNAVGMLRGAGRSAFASWRDLHARRQVLQADLAMAEQNLRALVKLWGAGKGMSLGRVARLQADIEGLRVEIDTVEAGLPLARARLNALLGRPAEAELPEPSLDLPNAATQVDVLKNHPGLQRLDLLGTAARARSHAEAAANAMTLMPGAGVMTMDQMPLGFMVTLGISAPNLGHADRGRARVAEGLAEAEALQLARTAKEREIRANLAEAFGRLRQLEARRQGLKSKVLPALRKAVEAGVPALAAGTGSVADLAESQRRLFDIELQVVDLDTQWLLARAAWLQLRESDAGPGMAGTTAPMGNGMNEPGMGDIGGMAGMGM